MSVWQKEKKINMYVLFYSHLFSYFLLYQHQLSHFPSNEEDWQKRKENKYVCPKILLICSLIFCYINTNQVTLQVSVQWRGPWASSNKTISCHFKYQTTLDHYHSTMLKITMWKMQVYVKIIDKNVELRKMCFTGSTLENTH